MKARDKKKQRAMGEKTGNLGTGKVFSAAVCKDPDVFGYGGVVEVSHLSDGQ